MDENILEEMKDNQDLIMSRAKKRLLKLHGVTDWLLSHWDDIPEDLYKKINDKFIPYDVKMLMVELVRQDFANAITPTLLYDDVLDAVEEAIKKGKENNA